MATQTPRYLILWDIDATLISVSGFGRRAYETAFETLLGQPLRHMAAMHGRTERAILADTLERNGVPADACSFTSFYQVIAATAEDLVGQMREHGRILPGAAVAIETLRAAGVVQTVVTGNVRAVAETKLRAFGLGAGLEFDLGGYGDLSEQRVDLVTRAIECAGRRYAAVFRPETTVVVGDTVHDVMAARDAGVRCVAVASGPSDMATLAEAGASAVLPDLADTSALMAALGLAGTALTGAGAAAETAPTACAASTAAPTAGLVPNPLEQLSLDQLRRRTSEKWLSYPSDVLPLWVAEMDTPLADPVRHVLERAIADGDTGYPHPHRLAEAFAGFAADRFGWQVDPGACRTVPNVMRGIDAILATVTEPGDGVLINPPVYPPFFTHVAALGRQVVPSPLRREPTGRWTIDLDRLDRDMAEPSVTAYLLCNPHNPTGTVFTARELSAVAALADRHGVRLLCDEIHAPLVYRGNRHVPLLSLADESEAAARAFAFTSANKGWNLPGLVAGIAIAGPAAVKDLPEETAPALDGVGHLGVLATTAAFSDGRQWLDALVDGLDANRRYLRDLLAMVLPEIGYRQPDATYLAWLDCADLGIGTDPARVFLDLGRVAVNPGRWFGRQADSHVRLNFATGQRILAAAVDRMAEAVLGARDRQN